MPQRAGKHCVSFFKLYTLKIPWSNHQLIKLVNVLVVSYCGKTLQYLSPKAFSPPALTLLGQTPPGSPSKWGTLVYTGSLDIFGKVFPISYNFQSRSSSTSQLHPHTPRLQESPSRASPAPLAFSFQCHMDTSGFWLSPELLCNAGPSYNSDIPKKMGHLERYDLTSDH